MSHDVEILHVDDDPQFADLTKTCLEREVDWFSVTTATSVEEGHEILDDNDVDCVVSDYDMPASTGIEFLSQVRERYPDLPFILYTGKGSEAVASDAITAGVTDYLQKGSGTSQYTILANRIQNAVAQRRARREAEQTRQRLTEVTEDVTDCIWLFDRDWEEILFVSGYEEVYNRPAEKLTQNPRDFLTVVKEEDRDLVRQKMAELSGGEPIDVEYRLEGDEPTWVWVKGSPITDEDGNVVRVAGFSRNITDRKEYENRLQTQNEQLDEFASVVSHDLRNPLNIATSRLELAREECDTDHHEPIDRALNRMERIIDDVLWLARNGRELGETEPVSVEPAVRAAWELVSDRSEDSLSITGQATRRLVADSDRLDHLLENLFANAVQHGGPGVDVRVEVTDDGFAIADDGPGIPAPERSDVFEAGYSTSADGFGFGLRIVEQVVQAHDWEIDVTESETGGARFEITGVEMRS